MTDAEQSEEFSYLIQERLGIICADKEPTDEERKQAVREATEHLKNISNFPR